MKKIILIFVVSLLAGCAAQLQKGMDTLESAWEKENTALISKLGTKYYKLDPVKAQKAMLIAFTNLGMIIEQQDSNTGFIVAKANAPRPLSTEEWARIRETEEPKARKISGLYLTLNAQNSDVIINSFIIPRESDIQINLRFRTKYTGNTHGLIIGHQPPPEAVKLGTAKIWNEFEKVAFIQNKTLD